jgi:hypothetical protein
VPEDPHGQRPGGVGALGREPLLGAHQPRRTPQEPAMAAETNNRTPINLERMLGPGLAG